MKNILKNLLILSSILMLINIKMIIGTESQLIEQSKIFNNIESDEFKKMDLKNKKLLLDDIIVMISWLQIPDQDRNYMPLRRSFKSKFEEIENKMDEYTQKMAFDIKYYGDTPKFLRKVMGLIYSQIKSELDATELVNYALALSGL